MLYYGSSLIYCIILVYQYSSYYVSLCAYIFSILKKNCIFATIYIER